MRHCRALRLPLLAAAILAAALALSACGGDDGGGTETTVAETEADVELLNEVLASQLATIEVYDQTLSNLRGGIRTLATEFRQQEQEHVDGLLEALQTLGGDEEVDPEEIESDPLHTEAQHLRFLYDVVSGTIEDELAAIGQMSDLGPSALLASMVANQAQHLVLLRRALGAIPLEWVPEPYETGATPAP